MEADGQQEIAGWHVTDVSIAHVPSLTPEEEESHRLFHADVSEGIFDGPEFMEDNASAMKAFAAHIWLVAFNRAEQVLAEKDGA